MKKNLLLLTFFLLFLFCGTAAYADSPIPLIDQADITAIEQTLHLGYTSAEWEKEAESYNLRKIKEFIKIHEIQVSRFHTKEELLEDGNSLPDSNAAQRLGSLSAQNGAFVSNQLLIHNKPKLNDGTSLLQATGLPSSRHVFTSIIDRKIKYIQGMSHYGPPDSE